MYQDTIITLEDMYKILHISKRKAKYILDNGIIPCVDTKKKTHRYLIKKNDVTDFLEKGIVFDYPNGLFSSGCNSKKTAQNILTVIDSNIAKKWYTKNLAKEKDILFMNDVKRLTGFSNEAIRKWIVDGDLFAIKNGCQMVVPKISLIEWMSTAKYLSRPQKSKIQIEQIGAMIKEKQQA